MAVSRQRRNVAYSQGQPLAFISPQPITSTRNPTTSDRAELGTVWVNKSTNASFVLTSVVANSSSWVAMTINGGATISTGNLTVVTGDINVTAGDITATAGDIVATAGDITATAGAVEAGTTVTAGTGVTATTGGLTATAGDITATADDIVADAGDIIVTLGDFTAATGGISVAADIESSGGDVVARTLFATGDEGTGSAGTVGFTDVVDTTLSTGAGVVLMKTANPQDSSGWLKIYVGTDVRYIPFWTTLSP